MSEKENTNFSDEKNWSEDRKTDRFHVCLLQLAQSALFIGNLVWSCHGWWCQPTTHTHTETCKMKMRRPMSTWIWPATMNRDDWKERKKKHKWKTFPLKWYKHCHGQMVKRPICWKFILSHTGNIWLWWPNNNLREMYKFHGWRYLLLYGPPQRPSTLYIE